MEPAGGAEGPVPAASPKPGANSIPRGRPGNPAGTTLATNAWARRAILSRARALDVTPDVARQVGNVGLWFYNRILVKLNPRGAPERELPPNANRYLVPISLALACEYKRLPIELDRLVRIAANPTRRTIEIAHELHSFYRSMLASAPTTRRPAGRERLSAPHPVGRPGPANGPSPEFRTRPLNPSALPHAPVAPASLRGGGAAVTALAIQSPASAVRDAPGVGRPRSESASPGANPHSRQVSTNAWARRRIADHGRALGLPEKVRGRALEFYDRIVAFHRTHGPGPPISKRVNLSPRLNWSLVYTTLYLACRFEEHPKDLRDILGPNARPGSIREMYRLYRFYKRKLRLTINLVDVKTFILSWLDGYEFGELVLEKMASSETAWLKNRALVIADRAQKDRTLRDASTKMIAAGALTTAIAERHPPGRLSAFYKAIARFLHMSEESIRHIVAQISGIL